MRPFVFINVATTVDGKLAPANRKFVPFGSRRDLDLLYELRAQSDAIIVGARTAEPPPAITVRARPNIGGCVWSEDSRITICV